MKENPLVSVIIPLYNSGKRFVPTLESVLRQTYHPIEVLLIDDGSTDGTPEIARELAQAHDNVRYYRKENGGVGSARNFGIGKARGDYLALCDHDDLWSAAKLEKQIPLFSNPAVGLVYAGSYYIEASDSYDFDALFYPCFTVDYKDRKYHEGKIYYDLLEYNCIAASSALFSREAINRVGLFADSWEMHGVDDKNMWLRIAHDFEVRAVKEVLVRWCVSERNWSKNEDKMLRSSLNCLDDVTRRFPEPASRSSIVKNAYRGIYMQAGLSLFNGEDYVLARTCFLNVLKRSPLSLRALLFFLCTFLPPALIEILRKPKRVILQQKPKRPVNASLNEGDPEC